MKKQRTLFCLVFGCCCLFTNYVKSQITAESFFSEISRFVAADYSNNNLSILKKWSDSNFIYNNNKNHIRQIEYIGMIITKEGIKIEYSFTASELQATAEKKTAGNILISHQGNCDVLLSPVLSFIPMYYMSFDTIDVKKGWKCSYDKIYLHFNNYNPSTNKVLESIDTSLVDMLKHEYFDFYFADIIKKTSTWQTEFKNFMQPYSDALILLLKKKNIQGVFKLIALKNKGYSWSLAEGLWYYNSIYPCLTVDQMKIVDAYNGKKGMIYFRTAEELKQIYKF